MADLSKSQLDTLRHMLGINQPEIKNPKPWRNYYAANPGDPRMVELAALGVVERYREPGPGNSYDYWRCTEAGIAAARASHRDIRWSKAKRMYTRFLDIRDCHCDLTFRDFLTRPEYAETRRNA